MAEQTMRPGTGRRVLIQGGIAAAAAVMLPPGIGASEAEAAEIARNRTLVLIGINSRDGRWVDHGLWNPYAIGANHQNGPNLMYEPLAYYSAFADKMYMWLAESFQYTPDFKQLTIKTRPGITWSDGHAVQRRGCRLHLQHAARPRAEGEMGRRRAIRHSTTPPSPTRTRSVLNFKIPSPRFFFFAAYKYDIGIYMVPKHIYQGQDWASFPHFDIAKGWPVTTGPWKVTESSLQQKVFERRDSWWAAEHKLAPMPQVLRNIWLPMVGEQETAQAQITNQSDFGGPLQPATFPTVIRQNPKVTSYSGQQPPWGYVDWWPISLYVNTEVKPFDEPDVRWALSHYVDRKQIIEVAYLGAETISTLPMPPYKPLLPYFDSRERPARQVQHDRVQSQERRRLARGEGIQKARRHVGGARTASPSRSTSSALAPPGSAMGPVLSAMLRRHGVDRQHEPAARFRRAASRRASSSARSTATAAASANPTTRCGCIRAKSIAVPGAHAGELQPLAQPGIRQDRRRGVHHRPRKTWRSSRTCSARRWRSGCRLCRTSSSCRTIIAFPTT